MNGFLDSQTSGNDWETPNHAMLHEIRQYKPNRSVTDVSLAVFNSLEAQMADFAADNRSTIEDVRRLYILSDDSLVIGFLNENLTIPQLLIHAAPRLREYFGEVAIFSLRTITDEYGWQTLYAVVVWPGPVRDVSEALNTFEDEWWIANSKSALGRLTFTYELL